MSIAISVGIALIVALAAWKVLKGLMKIASFMLLFVVAGVLYWQGVI